MSALIALLLAASPASRLTYENKCLYCHSADITEGPRLSDGGWRAVVERMRKKAPLLIHKSDVPRLAAYMTQVLERVPAGYSARPRRPAEKPEAKAAPDAGMPEVIAAAPAELKEPEPLPPEDPALRAALEAQAAAQTRLDEEGQALIERRCSKCHTLGRVFSKLDNPGASLATLDRMRWKTGSGISDEEAELIARFIRAQF